MVLTMNLTASLLQSHAVSAAQGISFICTSEKAAYHMQFSEGKKWEVGADETDTPFRISNSGGDEGSSSWRIDRLVEKNDPNLVVETYECSRQIVGTMIICEGKYQLNETRFRFNITNLRFDQLIYNPNWLYDRGGIAMLYKIGECVREKYK
jgi:hypothetical protein